MKVNILAIAFMLSVCFFAFYSCESETQSILDDYSTENPFYQWGYEVGYSSGFAQGCQEGYDYGYREARNGLRYSMDWFYSKYTHYR